MDQLENIEQPVKVDIDNDTVVNPIENFYQNSKMLKSKKLGVYLVVFLSEKLARWMYFIKQTLKMLCSNKSIKEFLKFKFSFVNFTGIFLISLFSGQFNCEVKPDFQKTNRNDNNNYRPVNNIISFSCHKEVCLTWLRFERCFSRHWVRCAPMMGEVFLKT